MAQIIGGKRGDRYALGEKMQCSQSFISQAFKFKLNSMRARELRHVALNYYSFIYIT